MKDKPYFKKSHSHKPLKGKGSYTREKSLETDCLSETREEEEHYIASEAYVRETNTNYNRNNNESKNFKEDNRTD